MGEFLFMPALMKPSSWATYECIRRGCLPLPHTGLDDRVGIVLADEAGVGVSEAVDHLLHCLRLDILDADDGCGFECG